MQKQLKVNLFYEAGQTTYTVPFDFLQKKFIGVKYLPKNYSVLDIDKAIPLVYGKDYTVNNKTLTLKQVEDSSKIINIYRETPTDSLVGFTDGSILKADNLNLFDTQILHITEELADYFIIHGRKISTTDDVQNIYIVDSLPDSAVPSDIAIVRSTKCVYQFMNNKWELIATPKAQYLLDYETLIKRNETSKTGEANKISFANSEGKLPNNITGSPDKILNKDIDKNIVPTEGTFFVFRNNKFSLEKSIDDTKLSTNTTYSSQKIDDTFLHKNGDTVSGNLNITGTITGTLKGNADTATKALQDIRGQQIDETYIKTVDVNDDTVTVLKGDNTKLIKKVNNVAHSLNADVSQKALNDDKGQKIDTTYVKNIEVDNDTITISKGNDSNVVKVINNVANATKALQDTRGQQIDKTYVKSVSVNGSQITITHGDGTVKNYAVSGSSGTVIEEYVRKLVGTNDTLTVTDGNDVATEIIINNIEHARNADIAVSATQDKVGTDLTTYVRHMLYDNKTCKIIFIRGNKERNEIDIKNVVHSQNADKAITDNLDQEISSTYIKEVTNGFDQHQRIPILNQVNITKGDDTLKTITINNVDNAKNVEKSFKFAFNPSDIKPKYRIFARMKNNNNTNTGNCALIVSSVGDFDDTCLGTYMVNLSNRGSVVSIHVAEIIPNKRPDKVHFGFYEEDGFFYVGFYCSTYCAPTAITVLSDDAREQIHIYRVNEFETEPAGWTKAPIFKLARYNADNHLVLPNGSEFWIG